MIGCFDSEVYFGEIRVDGRVLVVGEDLGKM